MTQIVKNEVWPGDGYRKIVCAICGATKRVKDCRKNWKGLVVCKEDWDPYPDQWRTPRIRKPEKIDPSWIKGPPTYSYHHFTTSAELVSGVESPPSYTVNNAPTNLRLYTTTSSSIELLWDAPAGGTDPVRSYKIERETPVGGGWATLVADTTNVIPYYKDTAVSSNTQYNYRVSAINGGGTSNPSATYAVTTPAS